MLVGTVYMCTATSSAKSHVKGNDIPAPAQLAPATKLTGPVEHVTLQLELLLHGSICDSRQTQHNMMTKSTCLLACWAYPI